MAGSILLAGTAPAVGAGPSCRTLDSSGRPATLFGAGDQIVVAGGGFPPSTTVRVDFLQGTLVPQIAEDRADPGGSFRAEAATVPPGALAGAASIRAASGLLSAECPIQVSVAGAVAARSHAGTLAVWAIALTLLGSFLVVVVWRYWREGHLSSAIEGRQTTSGVSRIPLLEVSDAERFVLRDDGHDDIPIDELDRSDEIVLESDRSPDEFVFIEEHRQADVDERLPPATDELERVSVADDDRDALGWPHLETEIEQSFARLHEELSGVSLTVARLIDEAKSWRRR